MLRIVAVSLVGIVVGLLALAVYMTMLPSDGDKYASCRASNIAGGAGSVGGPFELIDENSKLVSDTDVIDQPSLIYFGYTFCPDVCPFDAARNAEAATLLKQGGRSLKPIFISVDPDRDTPEILKDFTDYLHEDMLGLTGTSEQINNAVKAYRAYFNIHTAASEDDEFYLVDHSTFSYLVMPDDGFVEFYRNSTTSEDMAKSISCFIDKSS